jgi:hypothetical protein
MAGSRNFRVDTISRSDLMALTEEASRVSGIHYVMDAYRDEADMILEGADYMEVVNSSGVLRKHHVLAK